jgi:acetate CoA/acetoacetate CoA-transferase alpha subunit
MKLIDKSSSIEQAISQIGDGATVMVGGFGVPGTPFCLIDELVRQGPKNLTVIKNDANETSMGIDHLLTNGQVKRLIVSHIGLNPGAIKMMNAGELEVEFCAQGILAERIHAAGAGLKGFITDIGIDTTLAEGKQIVQMGEQDYLIETALKADFSLIHADRADPFGNLAYVASARNFNPLMAMASSYVIAEAEQVGSLGSISPDEVNTPGPFVDAVVAISELTQEYAVVRR